MKPWYLSRLNITFVFPMTGLPYKNPGADNFGMDAFLGQLIYWYTFKWLIIRGSMDGEPIRIMQIKGYLDVWGSQAGKQCVKGTEKRMVGTVTNWENTLSSLSSNQLLPCGNGSPGWQIFWLFKKTRETQTFVYDIQIFMRNILNCQHWQPVNLFVTAYYYRGSIHIL